MDRDTRTQSLHMDRDTHTQSLHMNRETGMHSSFQGRETYALTREVTSSTPGMPDQIGAAPLGRMNSSNISKHVVRLSDVSALLPRREFKLHGGQIVMQAVTCLSIVSVSKWIKGCRRVQ